MADEDIDTSNMSVEEMNALQKQNCIFCKIAEKQIPAKILHEDDKIICILDINPASEGHILVYPKEHYMILPHIPDDVVKHMFRIVKLMSNTILKTLQSGGTSIFIANGMAAGQKAPHVLVHVFPRREGDNLLELPKYEMTDDQSTNLKNMMKPYFEQVFGKGTPKEKKSIPLSNIPKKIEKKDTSIQESKKDVPKNKGKGKSDHNNEKSGGGVDLDDISRLFGA